MTSFDLFKFGENDVRIELIETFSCNTKEDLLKREGYHIRNNKCINRHIMGRTDKEYYEDNKYLLLPKYRENYRNNVNGNRCNVLTYIQTICIIGTWKVG